MEIKGKILPLHINKIVEQVSGCFSGTGPGTDVELRIQKTESGMGMCLQGANHSMNILTDTVPVESSGEGVWAFSWNDFKTMMTWPRGKGQELDWTIKPKGDGKISVMEIIRGKSRLEAETIENNLPVPEKCKPKTIIQVNSHSFSNAMKKCAVMAAREDVRYFLKGVYLECTGKSNVIDLVGTDGHRLGNVQVETIQIDGKASSVIVPNEGVTQLCMFLSKYATDVTAIGLTDNLLILRGTNGYRLRCRLVDGRYPDFRRVIPSVDDGITVSVDKEDFLLGLETAEKTFDGQGQPLVEMIYQSDRVDMKGFVHQSANTTIRRTEYTIEASGFEGESFPSFLNIKFVKDVLGNISDETVKMCVSGSSSPTLYLGQSELYLLMPVRP